ncbi:hypothetical protein [Mesorhizobium sp.]|uniref:hypothetical protein n=1 Tax=Mesorhizobium sp. TaxID=1871066 RepID=UPI000FEA0DE9|nr:hypothetical protein [Mesorhizobium sp.]RWI29628.1 MAG: hypothetical protein EOQ92_04630 [Mesorhizobium sp.]RWK52593.1 MAG: hypothetical protein EOR47_04220 [Mesorhizobium sp.]RWK90882.1 MAG: hypothetical protein EOR53_29725 [Mesorhizobium sp.]TIQ29752.1 MAG: hypothetical protein E5X54_12735 [Mesorhizobium sp.]
MRSINLLAVGSVCAVAGCQTATYTQYMPGPPLEYAQAKCNMLAPSVHQGYIAIGSPSYVAGAALGNALDNAIAEQKFIKNCMTLQGWRQDAPGAKKSSTSLASTQLPHQRTAKRRPTAQELGVPGQVVAGQ